MNIPLSHVLAVATALFVIGGAMAAARRSILMILIGVEFMLAAGSLAFVGAALAWGNVSGQAAVILIMGLASAEAALGLALLVHGRRGGGTVDADSYDRLGGDA
ncbi:NADH-quinone oxidoreductase subunit NuoK [Desulfovibrio sp. TomC]|uniref:NADH-quinone oxidoreductase subunit NuoK n=1 Tax=Desulfovibrio sp. TomC TaxID=1562888 RepID=UPI0005739AE6|nr:NADH-quinone oxidoreductase subunit NuoK [Desulfovibrio sp. TomC]KHK03323.1 NADH-ubiquinone oxidoreductase chain K [Desulfovibrio sp. TomC]